MPPFLCTGSHMHAQYWCLCMQALIAQEASSLVYELMDPAAPQSVVAQQGAGASVATEVSPVVILGFNEASQARPPLLPCNVVHA